MKFFPSSSASFSSASSVNLFSMTRTGTTTRRIGASILTGGVLFFCVTLEAQITNDLAEAVIQGRQLAQQILEQRPTENFTNTGTLQIRNANGKQVEIPIKVQTTLTMAGWVNTFECIKASNLTNDFIQIAHRNGLNIYLTSWNSGAVEAYNSGRIPDATESFASSDFWLCDLGLEFFHWPQQKILKHEMRRGRACQVLESTNPHPAPNGYSRVVSWIDNETLGIVQAEAYDTKGKLLKEFYPKSFKKVNGQWELQEMEIRNDQTGSRTRLEFNLKPPD